MRLALGATARRVIARIVTDSLRFAGKGALVGWGLAFLVYIHVAPGQPLDLPAFVGVPVLLLLVSAFASWLPAAAQAGSTRSSRCDRNDDLVTIVASSLATSPAGSRGRPKPADQACIEVHKRPDLDAFRRYRPSQFSEMVAGRSGDWMARLR